MISRQTVLLLIISIYLVTCEEWYMPNSNLISDKQFDGKIKNDTTCFKFVKFFTPHCPYCRHLKAAFDELKPKKQWCFKIYDLNCQWYPQFCRNNVRSTSFPYTVVYDENGNMFEQIHGFYPVPIISQIFDRIEQNCLSLKGQQPTQPTTITHEEQKQVEPEKQPEPVKKQEPKPVKRQEPEPMKRQEPAIVKSSEPQTPQSIDPVQQQTNQISHTPTIQHEAKQAQTIAAQNMQNAPSQMNPYFSYAFYTLCCLGAAYYVYSLQSKQQKDHDSDHLIPKSGSDEHIESPKKDDQPKLTQKKSSEQMHKQLQQNQLLYLADEQL